MRKAFLFTLFGSIVTVACAHNSYTGGYSGAPGTRTCASACHGGSGGTLTVTGFPTAYQPGQTYRITAKRNGGSPIVNFNATTRVGSTNTIAGSFAAVTNTALYTGADGGVYASPHTIDSAVFQWAAPASGTGSVTLYAAAYQGTTSSANGQSKAIAITSTEISSRVEDEPRMPTEFYLQQNFPNPFNPSTAIGYQLNTEHDLNLTVFNSLGQEIAALVNERVAAGFHTVRWNAFGSPSGTYFYRLRAGGQIETKRMVLTK